MPNWKKVIVSGSDASLNSLTVINGITGSLYGTASWAFSASNALDADLLDGKDSTEFATTGSNTFIGDQIVTGSLFTTGSNRLIGNTTLTGSLNITGSTIQIGNNTLIGNTSLSGSVIISGSQGAGAPTIQIFGDLNQTGYTRYLPVVTNIDTSISASYIFVSGSTQDLYFSQNSKGYNNVTRLRWLEGNLYTGLLNGGLITTQSSTVYQISSGSGIIVNLNASLNDNPYPTIQYLNWPNLSASIAPLTASYQQAFVGIDSTSNIYAQGTPFSNGQFDTVINIGNVLFQNQSTINGVKTQPSVAYGFEQAQNVFNRAFGPLKLSGYTLAPSGSSTGSLVVGSGTAYSPGSNYIIDPNEPYYTVDNGTQTSKIFRYYQSGSSWVYLTNAGAGFTTIDPSQYSNNGILTAIPSAGSNWSIQRVFWFPNSVTKAIVVYYGNAYYGTEADAIANLNIETFVEAPNTAANAIYLGAIVIRGSGVFTNANDFTILPGGLFRQVGGSGGGGSVVTQTLSGLSDVAISGPTNLQPLVYSTTAAKWINNSFISASIYGNAQTATSASYALIATSASHAIESDNAITASYVLNSVSSSFSSTASYVDPLYQAVKISGSLTVTGSTNLVGDTGITLFSANADVLTFTGSIFTSGSIVSVGSLNINRVTSSLFGTASWAINALTSSYINTLVQDLTISGSVFISGSLTVSGSNTFTNIGPTIFSGSVTSTGGFTGSLEGNATTASYVATASFAATSSFASTASVATSVAGGFSKSFAMINNSNISSNDIGTFQIWRCNVACTASMVLMYQDSGSSVAVNALKNGNALLASDLTNNSLDTWVSSSTLQNQNFAVGDILAFRLISLTGTPKEITIQTSFNYQ
jgi:hypothetical protein